MGPPRAFPRLRRRPSCTLRCLLPLAPCLGIARGVVLPEAATVTGSVEFLGSPPAPRVVTVDVDRETCGETVAIQDLRLRGRGVADAVVRAEALIPTAGGARGPALTPGPSVLEIRSCRLEPPVLAAPAGGVLGLRNMDPLVHDVRLTVHLSPGARMLLRVPLHGRGVRVEKREALQRPALINARCGIHPWMSATIVVLDHPHFALTGEDGSFEIGGLPPGDYTLRAWHPMLGAGQATVRLGKGRPTVARLFYPGPTSHPRHALGTDPSRTGVCLPAPVPSRYRTRGWAPGSSR